MPRFNAGNTRKQGRGKSYSLRMGQMFGPYSVGAIYPCDANTTVMIAGLDAYEQQVNKGALETIADSRLKRYVGVNRLYAPPVDDGHHGGFVPALRFPNWLYCPRCGQMQYKESTNVSTQIRCEACSKKISAILSSFQSVLSSCVHMAISIIFPLCSGCITEQTLIRNQENML